MNNSIYSLRKLRELARKLDRENNYTPCHSENVANLAMDLCKALGIRGKRKDMIIAACLIHDIGKVGIDQKILDKKERLTDIEWLRIKRHPTISAMLAKEAGYSDKVAEIIYYHHVWYNGNGYPKATKKGARIPIGARILAVCDTYESMISKRSYKEVASRQEAIDELKKNSIRQFDPRIVEVFSRAVAAENN